MTAAECLDVVVVSRPLVPEGMVGTHHQRMSVQFAQNHFLDELLVGHLGERLGEGLHHNRVDSLFFNQFQILIQRIYGEKARIRMKHAARMGVERQHHAGAVDPLRLLVQKTQNTDMPQVHAVESADSHYRIFEFR